MNSFADRQRHLKEQAAQEAIFEATLKVIAQKMDEGLKMSDIAEAAGIATGTLYNYFKNKKRLLFYVDQRLHQMILEKIKVFAEGPESAKGRLEKLTQALFHFAEKYHVVFDLAENFGVVAQIPVEEKKGRIYGAVKIIQSILDDGVQRKEFKKTNTAMTAQVYFACIIGTMELQRFLRAYDFSTNCTNIIGVFQSLLESSNE